MVHHRTKPQGQSRKYSVLVGRIKDGQEDPEGAGKSPHYEIWVDAAGVNYRIAVNVRSVDGSDVVAYYDPTFTGAAKLDPRNAGYCGEARLIGGRPVRGVTP